MEKKDIVEKEDTDAAADKVFMSFVEKGYPRSARELEAFIKKTKEKEPKEGIKGGFIQAINGYPKSARELEAFIKKTVLKDTVPCP